MPAPLLEPPSPSYLDDVRQKHREAQKYVESLYALTLARQVAEAVCNGVESRFRPELQSAYKKQNTLGKQLGFLEDHADAINLSGEMIAALRTLQAYGNYAAHYEKGTHRPSQRAAASAMASLALVVESLTFGEDQVGRTTHPLALKTPAPGGPNWRERQSLRRASSRPPRLEFAAPNQRQGHFIWVDLDGPLEGQLHQLGAYYANASNACARICRAVLTRETEEILPDEIDQLSLRFSQLAELRPERVPRSVAVLVAELLRRKQSVVLALQDGRKDIADLVLEARQQDPFDALAAWFERDYLAPGVVERRWRVWRRNVLLLGFSLCFLWLAYSIGWDHGASDVRFELHTRLCAGGATAPPADFCDAGRAP